MKKSDQFREILNEPKERNKPIAVIGHQNVCPDQIASMLLFEKFANNNGISSENLNFYNAIKGIQYNSSVSIKSLSKLNLRDPLNMNEEYLIVLDTSSKNYSGIPKSLETNVLAVIDHHTSKEESADIFHGKFEDIRKTSCCNSILYSYLKESGIKINERDEGERKLASAMIFGLMADSGNPLGLINLNLPKEDWVMLNDVRNIYDVDLVKNIARSDYDISLLHNFRNGIFLTSSDTKLQVYIHSVPEDDQKLSQMASVANWFGGLDGFLLISPLPTSQSNDKNYSLKGRCSNYYMSSLDLAKEVFPNEPNIFGRKEMCGGYLNSIPSHQEIVLSLNKYSKILLKKN